MVGDGGDDPAELDKRHCWHPFTQMSEWCDSGHDPVVLVRGRGSRLWDREGREYIDGNSSIWTNIHGHAHPAINEAIAEQLERVAHVSYLGFAHEPAALLARRLVAAYPGDALQRVFYSDDGSTAIEVALKMAVQYWQQTGHPERVRFIAFENAYHGDTMGASSLGGVRLFHERFASYQFPVSHVATLGELEAEAEPATVAAVVIEPLVQGVNGMRVWPKGMLAGLRAWCDAHGVLLVADEIMTGFGRTGTLFACEQEGVAPDVACLAKGLTGGYLPLAATLVTENIYDAFLGTFEERKTFFYGHSYTANPLGCAAALASLELFDTEQTLERLQPKIRLLGELLEDLAGHPRIGAVRQCGLIAGIDIVEERGPIKRFDPSHRMGARVCVEARKHGLLTRPIQDTVVLMPPLCTTEEDLRQCVEAIHLGVDGVVGH